MKKFQRRVITALLYFNLQGVIDIEKYEKEYGKKLDARNIRHVCESKRNHVNNLKFEYITQEEFNNIKSTTPELVIGECFKLKETA